LAGVHVELNDDGDLVSYCYKHDPVYAQQRKEQQKQQLVADAVSKFAVGTNVVAKWGGWTYEGVVLEIQVEQRGCMVQFEEQYLILI
jgi:sRNA-binding protein